MTKYSQQERLRIETARRDAFVDKFSLGNRPYFDEYYWCQRIVYAPGRADLVNGIESRIKGIAKLVAPILAATAPIEQRSEASIKYNHQFFNNIPKTDKYAPMDETDEIL